MTELPKGIRADRGEVYLGTLRPEHVGKRCVDLYWRNGVQLLREVTASDVGRDVYAIQLEDGSSIAVVDRENT